MNQLTLEKTTVLGGLVYFPAIRRKYVSLVEPTERILDTQRSAYHSAESLISVLIRADINVTAEYVMKMLCQQYNRISPSAKEIRLDYVNILQQLDENKIFTEAICMRLFDETMKAKAIRELQTELTQPKSIDSMEEAIAQFNTAVSTIRQNPGDEIRVWNPLDDMEELLVEKPRTPTGVAIIDKILSGGIALGEHTGILGPSGGGKSLIANMLACNLAIRKYNTLLIQTEQTISGDIASRMYAYMLGVPMSTFIGKKPEEIDPAIRGRLRELKPIWDRIRCVSTADRTAKTSRASNEVVDIIQRVMDTGFVPQFVIIDWLGKLVLDFMRASEGNNSDFYMKAEDLKATLNTFFRANNMSAIYLHQTDTETQNREPGYKPRKNNADKYRAFANDLESCICIGTATKFDNGLQVAWIGADKARMMQSGKYVMAKIDGSHAKITECEEGEYALNAKGQFQPVRELIGVSGKTAARLAEAVYVPPEGSSDAFLQENY